MIRLFITFAVLALATSGFLYLTLCTDHFKDSRRLRRYARNSALAAAGGFIAAVTCLLLIALS